MRVQLSTWRTSLSAALGLAALACGGSSTHEGTGGDDGTGGGPPLDLSCQNPEPLVGFDGSNTGFVSCDRGFTHRPERLDCPSQVPRPETVDSTGVTNVSCTTDADCTTLPNGYCTRVSTYFGGLRIVCVAGCVRDEDCGDGRVCFCGDPVGTCVDAKCASDADCGGLLCTGSPALDSCITGGLVANFVCQSTDDACRSDEDCASVVTATGAAVCSATPEGRVCFPPGVCGRPFLIDGEARLACVVGCDTGWTNESKPSVLALDRATRDELAEHYSRIGAMEHASVAAFARFVLDLLSLGAPAELVLLAQSALGDEIRHARMCFGLAAAYAGWPLGPGPLSAEGALDGASFEEIVERAIIEACIGETLAAVEAAEAAAHTSDPAVRSALLEITEDEKRHAELGWRFLRWALERATAAERSRLETVLAARITEARARTQAESGATSTREVLLAHGVLSAKLANVARVAALDELVLPLARAIVQATARPTSDSRAAEKTTASSASSA